MLTFPDKPDFGIDYPWADTNPMKLALPWTSIPPVATSPTVALVALDEHSVLIVSNRGNVRTAVRIPGIVNFKLYDLSSSAYGVDITCPSGEIITIAYLPKKTWNSLEHPKYVRFLPFTEGDSPCGG